MPPKAHSSPAEKAGLPWQPGGLRAQRPQTALTKAKAAKHHSGVAADTWLASWGAFGRAFDNVVWKKGRPIRIDNGGAPLFRARAGRKSKAALEKLTEVAGFFNPHKNFPYANVMDKANVRVVEALARLRCSSPMPKASPHAGTPYRAVLSAPEVTPPAAKAAEQITYPNGYRARCQQSACFASGVGGDGSPIRTGALKRRPYPLLPCPTSLFCFCSKFKWGLNGV